MTPYFVPRKTGAALLESYVKQGVRVRVVTNSLASTNHVPVHSGYARYRKRLLEAGVELYELRASSSIEMDDGTRTRSEQSYGQVSQVDSAKSMVDLCGSRDSSMCEEEQRWSDDVISCEWPDRWRS